MDEPRAMPPAFASRAHAALLGALVVVFLALPALLSSAGLYRRRDAYREMPIGVGGFRFIEKEALEERSDIDVLCVGASILWFGVDAPTLRDELDRARSARPADGSPKEPARVLSFGYSHAGADVSFAMLRDVLERRKVRTVVATMPHVDEVGDAPHTYAYHFLPWEPDLRRGLSARHQIVLYAESVLGAPRHLLSLLRPNADAVHPVAASLGSHREDHGFHGAAFDPPPFEPPRFSADELVYGPGSADRFAFAGRPLSDYQAHFVRRIAEITCEHGARLVVIRVPWWSDRRRPVVDERLDWSRELGDDVAMVGVPPARLYAGLSEDDVKRLYFDEHLNMAGARFFTRAVAPAIVAIDERGARPGKEEHAH